MNIIEIIEIEKKRRVDLISIWIGIIVITMYYYVWNIGYSAFGRTNADGIF